MEPLHLAPTDLDALQRTRLALSDALEWLVDLSREGLDPPTATRRLRQLRERHPGLEFNLVWELEAYTRVYHYDLLVHPGPVGSISLSFCPDRGVPWPLRSAHHAPDGHIVHVNGRAIDVAKAMTTLDFLWGERGLVRSLVDLGIVEDVIVRRGLEVTAEELQQAMNRFRRRNGLLTKQATLDFLSTHGLTQEVLEHRVESEALYDKLRDEVAGDRIDAWFETHRAELDVAHVARLRVEDDARGRRVIDDLGAGRDFYLIAQERFLADPSGRGNLFVTLRRGALDPAQARAIFDARPGDVIGPVRSGDGLDVVRVLEIRPATLDEATRDVVKRRLFDAWLEEQRRSATVTWFWGDAVRMQNYLGGRPM
jgi:putative peptide maturation system protein